MSELALLRSSFESENSDVLFTPSGNYYWYRKRHQVMSLLRSNRLALTRPDMLVIDLGCGTGTDLFLIRRVLGVQGHFIGIEAESAALRTCRLRAEYHRASDVSFLEHDLTRGIPVEDDEVGLAYCSEVVEHLPDPDALIADVARVLRPGGHLLLTTPNQPNILQRSFWNRRRRARMTRESEAEREETRMAAERAGTTPIYGHISVRTAKAWDQAASRNGLKLIDFGRGALFYGGSPWLDRELALGGMFLLQGALDVLPKTLTRAVSDQLIALYQRQ
jgi:ubiquinone/menaquinone biosynthesis C-methylase UbiE